VPDLYQGTEFWDFSLVDPDNRCPVDYSARQAALDADDPQGVAASWRNGGIKLFVISRLLDLRRRRPELFREASYRRLEITGAKAGCCVAYERRADAARLVVIVPRLASSIVRGAPALGFAGESWQGTSVAIGDELPMRHLFTAGAVNDGSLRNLFEAFPVGVLEG
jgi:(1->4)-alpha-D-glucan 1-alpha-D-glucosylmutase